VDLGGADAVPVSTESQSLVDRLLTIVPENPVAALADRDYVAESRRLNDAGLAYLNAACVERALPVIPSVGNFVTIRVGALGVAADAVYEGLLREGVIVRPVAGYGLPEHLRVTVGLPLENERFVAALDRVLTRLGAVRPESGPA
jgi:histidinol-phosphate aminotransferase